MTYIESLDPNGPMLIDLDALTAMWDAEFPDWRDREADPERFVSESDCFVK